jgi:hypothetical protein
LIFRYQIFAFGQDARVCNTFIRGFPSQGIGSMDSPSAMAAHSKVFIVARNKHIVPKQRRIERLLSGYSIQESRDDSRGRYWYVVAALEVLMVAQETLI